MRNSEIKLRAYELVADLIDSALAGGWELSQDEKEAALIQKEIEIIEDKLRKCTL